MLISIKEKREYSVMVFLFLKTHRARYVPCCEGCEGFVYTPSQLLSDHIMYLYVHTTEIPYMDFGPRQKIPLMTAHDTATMVCIVTVTVNALSVTV